MRFLGFLMMKNLVKPQSADVISTLRRAQLRCIMVTGTGRHFFPPFPSHSSSELSGVSVLISLAPVDSHLVPTDQSDAGDNILTAVNVAKSCSMVASDEQVIFVDAKPQTAQSAPTLTFNLEDDHGAVEVVTLVGPAS